MRLQVNSKPVIIVDTREQDSLADLFSDAVIVERGTLKTGDYTIKPPVVEPRPRPPRTLRGKRHPLDIAPAHTFTEVTDDGEVRDAPHAGIVVDMRPPRLWIACERKSLADLVGCVVAEREDGSGGRERFEREMLRLSAYEHKAIVVEARLEDVWLRGVLPTLEDLLKHADSDEARRKVRRDIERVKARTYRANVSPAAVEATTIALQLRYGVPTIWTGTRQGSARWIERFLVTAWRWRVERERWSLAGAVKPHVGADGAAMPYGDGI